MVRITSARVLEGNVNLIEAAGLSTDTKPSGVATGSTFLEVDTGDVYAYDEHGKEWDKIAELGGGA